MGKVSYLDALKAREAALQEEVKHLRQERQRYESEATRLEDLRQRNRRELAGYLVPDLDEEDLAAVEKRFLLTSLRAAKRPFEAELQAADTEREALETDPRFTQYDVHVVDIETQLAEIAEACASFRADRAPWEACKHFHELKDRGWFTPDYDSGLWTWLRDWRAASLLMAHIEDARPFTRFADDDALKAAWSALDAASAPVLALEASLHERRAELERVKARHAELVAAPAEIFKRCWDAVAERLVDHLEAAPEDVLVAAAKKDEQLAVFLKKSVGLQKQAEYLRELAAARLDPTIARLVEDAAKTRSKIDKVLYKLVRGKYIAAPSDLASLSPPREKWLKARYSFGKLRDRVGTFDRWDRGSFVQDYLWWDLVTRGARGDDLYEVRVFHERHPDWSPDRFVDPSARDDDLRATESADLAARSTVDGFVDDGASFQDAS